MIVLFLARFIINFVSCLLIDGVNEVLLSNLPSESV